MSLLATVLAGTPVLAGTHVLTASHVLAEAKAPLIMPPIGFALIAFGIFLVLGVITWTYRDVANRHAVKASMTHHDDHEHGSAGHQHGSADQH